MITLLELPSIPQNAVSLPRLPVTIYDKPPCRWVEYVVTPDAGRTGLRATLSIWTINAAAGRFILSQDGLRLFLAHFRLASSPRAGRQLVVAVHIPTFTVCFRRCRVHIRALSGVQTSFSTVRALPIWMRLSRQPTCSRACCKKSLPAAFPPGPSSTPINAAYGAARPIAFCIVIDLSR